MNIAPITAPIYIGPALRGDVSCEILDTSLVSQGIIDITTLSATLYYNSVGSWACAAKYSDALWTKLQSLISGGGFELVFNFGNEFQFGGRCEVPGYQDSVPGVTNSAVFTSGPMIVMSGADFLALLANRIAYPNPTADWSSNLLTDHDDQSAVAAETAIKHYIKANTGATAPADRKISFLSVATDLARGGTVSYTAKIQKGNDLSLMDVIRNLAAAGGPIGVSIAQSGAALVADCYIPRDLTSIAYFSKDLGNLTSVGLQIADPTVNSALVIGSAALQEETGAGASSPWTRIEQIVDQSGSSDSTKNAQAGTAVIAQGVANPTLTVSALDIPRLQFGRDYYLGDKVTVEVANGDTYADIISQVDFTFDAAQTPPVTIVPTIGASAAPGNSDPSLTAQLVRTVQRLERLLASK